jgi:hypothetical protein
MSDPGGSSSKAKGKKKGGCRGAVGKIESKG